MTPDEALAAARPAAHNAIDFGEPPRAPFLVVHSDDGDTEAIRDAVLAAIRDSRHWPVLMGREMPALGNQAAEGKRSWFGVDLASGQDVSVPVSFVPPADLDRLRAVERAALAVIAAVEPVPLNPGMRRMPRVGTGAASIEALRAALEGRAAEQPWTCVACGAPVPDGERHADCPADRGAEA
jgi:hypothetical protein